jgi:NAD(P)-dependent dehydrogenase (short-subunit alcohol dehydrogenase family)
MKIANAVALVTGANRGIGASLVRELTARGAARVYAAARHPGTLAAAGAASQDVIVPLTLDVTDPAQVAAAAAAAPDVTLLINNAGILTSGGFLDASPDDIERELAVNFLGMLRTTRAFVPAIEGNGGGAVVNLLSVLALAPMPGAAAYSAAKAAADSATRSLRAEAAARNITVHGVYPAFVDTDMTAHIDAEKADPADVARATLDAVEQATGDVLPDPVAIGLWQAWTDHPRGLDQLFAGG